MESFLARLLQLCLFFRVPPSSVLLRITLMMSLDWLYSTNTSWTPDYTQLSLITLICVSLTFSSPSNFFLLLLLLLSPGGRALSLQTRLTTIRVNTRKRPAEAVIQDAKFYGPHFCVKTLYTLSVNRPFLLPYFCDKKEYWTCSCLRMLGSFTLMNLRYINRVLRIHMQNLNTEGGQKHISRIVKPQSPIPLIPNPPRSNPNPIPTNPKGECG